MDFSLNEEQQAVRDLARKILVDLVTNDRLLEEVRQSFHDIRDPLTFTTLLPQDARPPAKLPKR